MKIITISISFVLFCIAAMINSEAYGKTIHVFVALCDNDSQGIVPVPETLGNGDKPENNLYWGAMFGVKTVFTKSKQWKLVLLQKHISETILERAVFVNLREQDVYLIADAYRGKNINDAIKDLLKSSAGTYDLKVTIKDKLIIHGGSTSDLLVYVGHDAFMDFWKPSVLYKKLFKTFPAGSKEGEPRNVFVLSCYSKDYFKTPLKKANGYPLLWTKSKLAPEAYILEGALEGWMKNESGQKIADRAAKAYSAYQKCSLKAAKTIFTSGW